MGQGVDRRPGRVASPTRSIPVPYPTMSIDEICKMNIAEIADKQSHLWLWTTNKMLHEAFHVMEAWGFKYHNTVTYYKAAGVGAWFVNKTQHLLFGYRGKMEMGPGRYTPTIAHFRPEKHSRKPESSYTMIESISFPPRLELFARPPVHLGWDVWGNEVSSDVQL